jgi:hypothetical protein
MSFMLIDDFAQLPPGKSIHGRRGGNGQFWTHDRWQDDGSGFVPATSGGRAVLRCDAGAGTATIPLAVAPIPGEAATLFFRFCYPHGGRALPAVSLVRDPLPTPPAAVEFEPGVWYSVWQEFDGAGRLELFTARDGGRRRAAGSSAAAAVGCRDAVTVAAGSTCCLLADLYVHPRRRSGGDPRREHPPIILKPNLVHVVCPAGAPAAGAASEAAMVLAEYLGRALGCTVEISSERRADTGWTNVHVGDTGLPNVGAIVSTLRAEEYVILAAGAADLVLAGRDEPGEPDVNPATHRTWVALYLNVQAGGRRETPTLSAAGRFLERFAGVRWYWPALDPGLGEKVPLHDGGIEVPGGTYVREAPSFPIRDLKVLLISMKYNKPYVTHGRWYRLNGLGVRNRLWHQHYWWWLIAKCRHLVENPCVAGDNPPASPALHADTAHFFAGLQVPIPGTDPQQYELVRGRNEAITAEMSGGKWSCDGGDPPLPKPTYAKFNQLCVAGEAGKASVMDAMVARMAELYEKPEEKATCACIAPNDADGYCDCTPCKALDENEDGSIDTVPLSGNRSIANRMFGFFNEVARAAAQDRLRAWAASRASGVGEEANPSGDRPRRPDSGWVTTHAYHDYLVPHVLREEDESKALTYLAPNLVVFDTHNGYAYRKYDTFGATPDAPGVQSLDPWTNSRADTWDRMRRWSRTNVPSRGTGHLASYSVLHYVTDKLDPYLRDALITAGPEPVGEYLGLHAHNRYLGAYVDAGLCNLLDRWLVARLLAHGPPAVDGDVDGQATVDLYVQRARDELDDYYAGLFGAGTQDEADARFLDEQVQARIKKVVETGSAQAGLGFLGSWSPHRLYREVFSVLLADNVAQDCVTRLRESSSFAAQAYAHKWEFTRLTWAVLEAVDGGVPMHYEYNYALHENALETCLALQASWEERERLVWALTGWEKVPSYFGMVVSAGVLADEQWQSPLQLEGGGVLDMQTAVPLARAVTRVDAAIKALVGAGQPLVLLPYGKMQTLSRPRLASHWACTWKGDGDALDTLQFSRVPARSPAGDGSSRSFIVVFNEQPVAVETELRLYDLDAAYTGWKLYRCAETNEEWGEDLLYEHAGTAVAASPSSSTAPTEVYQARVSFQAEPGTNVLCLKGVNFAVATNRATQMTFVGRGGDGTWTVPANVEGTWDELKKAGWLMRMYPHDDDIMSVPVGRFSVEPDGAPDGTEVAECDAKWGSNNVTTTGEDDYVQLLSANLADLRVPNDPQKTAWTPQPGTYRIYGMARDRDQAARHMVDAAGQRFYITLTLK